MLDDDVTPINVFTVEPSRQRELVALLTRATAESVRHAVGFISARLHRSHDGTTVTMYSQWRSIEAYSRCEWTRRPCRTSAKLLQLRRSSRGFTRTSRRFFLPQATSNLIVRRMGEAVSRDPAKGAC